ncbi:VacJ family lipoprotein [Actibacterium sp. XHP0104]|uniref:MlaA family lipoprotein n=1 Tax=Actibacterium sp. XHP0104 TaxID=2984335 RepID=UPI0021E8F59C|nr:VacJ family lipoprotein [Actibacterium sp. XHP0104]MCV2881649.1 VacJ family lipoprotein [Actibacterium sp. XHP0104]
MPRPFRLVAITLAFAALAACSAKTPGGINDPHEQQNRQVHAFNAGLDRMLMRPTSHAYGSILPQPVRTGVGNFASNLSLPGVIVNDLLQLNIKDALSNTGRFAFNTVVGVGGVLDPATHIGLAERPTDFGETLHVWGVGEGDYMELPVLGPSTERDTVGKVVDFVISPTRLLLNSPEREYALGIQFSAKLGQRYRFTDTVDSILYDSADSYAQARLLYLQNRRFQLNGQEDLTYADPYGDPYDDAYADPYEDPYAQ